MKYALLIYDGPQWATLSDADREVAYKEYYEISALPEVVGGEQLAPADEATTVRESDSQVTMVEGTSSSSQEALGGYFVVDVADIGSALQLAARIPAVHYGGAVEVRAVIEN